MSVKEAVTKALTASLSAAKKAAKPKTARGKSPYILFTIEKRAALASDPSFSSLGATEKMKKLGAMWNDLSDAGKTPYNAKAAAEKAALSTAPAPSDDDVSYPFEVKFTEKKVASLAKTLANAALTSIFEDLKEGKKITLDSVGKLTPGEADEKGAMAITVKPPQKKKEK